MVTKRIFALMSATMLVVGCTVLDPVPPEELVARKAQKRVDLLMQGDFEAAYDFTTPGYRSTEGVGRYGTRWAGTQMWLSAVVERVNCTPVQAGMGAPERCEALLRVTYEAPGMGPMTTTLLEDWILTEGDWYLYQKF